MNSNKCATCGIEKSKHDRGNHCGKFMTSDNKDSVNRQTTEHPDSWTIKDSSNYDKLVREFLSYCKYTHIYIEPSHLDMFKKLEKNFKASHKTGVGE